MKVTVSHYMDGIDLYTVSVERKKKGLLGEMSTNPEQDIHVEVNAPVGATTTEYAITFALELVEMFISTEKDS